MAVEKQLKFKFVVDETSFQRVKQALTELTTQARNFAEALRTVGGPPGSGGMLGGGNVGGAAPSNSATVAKAAPQVQKVGFASAVVQQSDAFKRAAREGSGAMKEMKDAFRLGVGEQLDHIRKLREELKSLTSAYKGLGGSSNAIGRGVLQRILQTRGQMTDAQTDLAKFRSLREEGREKIPFADPKDVHEVGGMFSQLRAKLNGAGGGGLMGMPMSAAGPQIAQLLGQLPGGGLLTGMLRGGPAAMAAAGGVAAANSQYQAWVNSPNAMAQRQAQFAGDMSGYARKIRGGDYSDIRAMDEIQNDPTKRAEYETETKPGWMRRQLNKYEAFKQADGFKESIDEMMEGTDGAHYRNVLRQRQKKRLDLEVEGQGVFNDIYADATSNSHGKMATMRALGVGDGYNKKTGVYRSNSERLLMGYSQFDPGEVIGAVQGIGASGQRGAAYSNGLLGTTLQAQAAGINGAANIAGVMSRQGGTKGADFINLLRSTAGAGTDVSTTSLLGNYVAQQADRANIAQFSGEGMLGALSYGTQNNAQGGMIARQNIAGMNETQKLYSGARDPWQKAVNFMEARKAAPDAGYYAQQYLATKLDAGRMADIMSGKIELTGEEKALGITPDMLKAQAQGMQKTRAVRTMSGGFAEGSDAAKMVSGLQSGSSLRDYAKGAFAGKDQKWSKAEREKAIDTYATVLRAGDPNMDLSTAEGTARLELFGQGTKGAKGPMKGDPGGGSLEAKEAKAAADRRKVDLDLKDSTAEKLEEVVAKSVDAYKRLVINSGNMATTVGNLDDMLKILAKRIKATNGGDSGSNVKNKPKE